MGFSFKVSCEAGSVEAALADESLMFERKVASISIPFTSTVVAVATFLNWSIVQARSATDGPARFICGASFEYDYGPGSLYSPDA